MEVKAETVREETVDRIIKKTQLTSNFISLTVAIIAALGVGFGFYFNTDNRLNQCEQNIQQLEKVVKKNTEHINQIQVYKGVSSAEMKMIEKKVDKIDEKLDKLILLQQK